MLRVFPIRDNQSPKDRIQSRLMILAALAMLAYALILSLAPAIRFHASDGRYRLDHWLGIVIWLGIFSFFHHQSAKRLPERDPYLLPLTAFLTGLGLMTIWRLAPSLGLRQTIWLVIASLVVFLGFQFPIFLTYLRRYKYIWLVSGLILTALTIILGQNPTGAGPKLWLRIFGIYMQPSEPLKLLLIAYLAAYFTDRPAIRYQFLEGFLPTILIVGMTLLLLISQQDLGTASIFLMIYLAMLYTARGEKYILWITPVLILLASVLGYFFVDIVRVRIDTWLFPFADPSGAAYQVIQSMIAIAEGSLMGAGPGLGSPSLIPVAVSDFIFSAIAEELGSMGVAALILMVLLLIFRGAKTALRSKKTYHRYLALGLVFYFGIQSILIIGGNIGLLPLTGVTLPFVSYGGSSLVVSFAAFLILITISNETNQSQADKPTATQNRYILISGLLMALMLIEIVVTTMFSFWRRPNLIARAENPRWVVYDRFQERGAILDRNEQPLITNIGEVGNFQRTSNHTPLYPILGYTNGVYGQTGIELSMYPFLRGLEGYPYEHLFWNDLLYNQPPEGLDVRLTLDLKTQRRADALLGDRDGAILLLNAQSGEILVMASHPYFDAASLEEEWQTLVSDSRAPLVNRATQGKYPAGTTLLPFILASVEDDILEAEAPDCIFPQLDQGLACALALDAPPDWSTLVASGCPMAQETLGKLAGTEDLFALYDSLGFYSEPALRLSVAEMKRPSFILDDPAFYRGETAVKISPLQMALAASTITNQGQLPGPRIVNGYRSPDGAWVSLPKLGENQRVFSEDTVSYINSLITPPQAAYWFVTATVPTEDEQTITWFVAGTSPAWQGQPLTLVVILEANAPEEATAIGQTLLEETIQ